MSNQAAKNRKHIDELHFENVLNLNKLAFYKQEIEIFKNRLREIILKNTKTEVTSRVEQFQNQFIRQIEVIDELNHKIKEHEQTLVQRAQDNITAIDHVLFEDNSAITSDMLRFTELYNELKNNYIRFLSERM